jgi:hypothetical protein
MSRATEVLAAAIFTHRHADRRPRLHRQGGQGSLLGLAALAALSSAPSSSVVASLIAHSPFRRAIAARMERL